MDHIFSTLLQFAREYSTPLGLLVGLAAFDSLSRIMRRTERSVPERAEAPSLDCPHCTHCRGGNPYSGLSCRM